MWKQFYIKQFSLVQVQFQYQKKVLFQTIQFSISTQFAKTVLIQTIQFSITTDFVYT